MRRRTLIELSIVAVILVGAAIVGSLIESGAIRDGLIRLCCLGLFALSLNLLVGYTGLLSFGHALFFGLGAYVFAILLRTGMIGIPAAGLLTLASRSSLQFSVV
jgi:branched-chain amino acid transport system permease protein